MNTFDKRKESEEKKFAHDNEMEFKITVRRNRLLGEWVAEQLGMRQDEVSDYCKSVVEADFFEPGDEDVLRKIKADFEHAGVDIDELDLTEKLAELQEIAK